MIVRTGSVRRDILRIWLPLAVFALLVCVRMPEIILRGRFWAEEGTEFFANAWVAPPLSALFTSYGGYLNFVANAAALVARWAVPLAWAPYVTIMTGLAFQLCPPLLLLTARDAWLQPTHVRLSAVLLLLLVPCSEEIWLQTLHCQFELLLCCALILALGETAGSQTLFRLGLLVLAPLTSVVSIALLPLFVLRAALDRSRPRLLQTLALAVPAIVQLLFFFHPVAGRGYALHPVLLLCALTIRHLALPFLGLETANNIATSIRASLQMSQIPFLAALLPVPVALLLGAASVTRRGPGAAFWFLAASALIAVASYAGAIGGVPMLLQDVRSGERYVIVPQALFYMTLVALSATSIGWKRRAFQWIVVWLVVVGIKSVMIPASYEADGPPWQQEVQAWQANPHHIIKLWPVDWTMTLDPLHITKNK